MASTADYENLLRDQSRWKRFGKQASALIQSRLLFAVLLGVITTILRVALFDYHYLKLQCLPNHDMSQAVSFFATNMHSLRTAGELAFWNPASNNGYAQYYQSFLSPLAPTPTHIAFIIWSQMVMVLSKIGLKFPEYMQYLNFTYIFSPFLLGTSASLLFFQIFSRRSIVALLVLGFSFSSVGNWNSAWFYFQESMTLLAVLASFIGVFKRPTTSRFLLLAAALVVQLCSVNYWTVYNSWFMAIFIGSFCAMYPTRVRRLGARLVQFARLRKNLVSTVALMSALSIGLSIACLGSAYVEQGKHHIRASINRKEYKVEDVLDRVRELRRTTLEFFNPSVDRALTSYKSDNEVHNARYIGLVFLPLLLMLPVLVWRRKERWLSAVLFSTLIVAMGFPLVGYLWKATPMLSTNQHVFYFYSQYLQIALMLVAAAVLERLLVRNFDQAERRRLSLVSISTAAVCVLALFGYHLCSRSFQVNDAELQAALYSYVLVLAVTVVIAQQLFDRNSKGSGLLLTLLLSFSAVDLTKYFQHVEELDQSFSRSFLLEKRSHRQTHWAGYAQLAAVAKPEDASLELNSHARILKKVWSKPDDSLGFAGGLTRNMPIFTDFWPINQFLWANNLSKFNDLPRDVQIAEFAQSPVQLLSDADIEYGDNFSHQTEGLDDWKTYSEAKFSATETSSATGSLHEKEIPGFSYRLHARGYNDFTIDVNAPQAGMLLVHQLHDPCWKYSIDGNQVSSSSARLIDTILPMQSGAHTVSMHYRPLARTLYWPAVLAQEFTVFCLLFLAFRERKTKLNLSTSSSIAPDTAEATV